MKHPSCLKPGDKVAIVAPARKVSQQEVEPALNLLRLWGLEAITPPHLYDSCDQLAGSDEIRFQTLQQQLDNPDIRAIFCVRGGYGTVRIIDRLQFAQFSQHPKWIVGYSDITVLHSHIHRNLDIETLHATMPIDIPIDAAEKNLPSVQTLRDALFGNALSYQCNPHKFNRSGIATGQLVGGNLSILYSLCGSPSDIHTRDKILFIEDLDEYLYHIDRMMMNLKRCGHLEGLAGLVVGQLSNMHDNATRFGRDAEEIIRDAVREYGYPILFNFPAGHNGTNNHALILGRETSLVVSDTSASLVQHPSVR